MIEKLEEKFKDIEKESAPHPLTQPEKQDIDQDSDKTTDKTAIDSKIVEMTETETSEKRDDNDKIADIGAVAEAENALDVPVRTEEIAEASGGYSDDAYLAAIRRNMDLKRQIYELKSLQLDRQQNNWNWNWASGFRSD